MCSFLIRSQSSLPAQKPSSLGSLSMNDPTIHSINREKMVLKMVQPFDRGSSGLHAESTSHSWKENLFFNLFDFKSQGLCKIWQLIQLGNKVKLISLHMFNFIKSRKHHFHQPVAQCFSGVMGLPVTPTKVIS